MIYPTQSGDVELTVSVSLATAASVLELASVQGKSVDQILRKVVTQAINPAEVEDDEA